MADSGEVHIGAEKFAALLKEAAKLGAEEALRELGLEKPEDRGDLKEALELAKMWRKTKSSIWDTTVKMLTAAVLGALALGMAMGLIKQIP